MLEAVVEACQAHGIEAIRWPWEPGGRGAKPWLLQALCRRGARVAAELARPVALWGLTASGQLTTPRLAAIARRLPPGVSEIMVHPATADEVAYPGYLGAQELAALLDASIAAQLPAPVTFGALARPATR